MLAAVFMGSLEPPSFAANARPTGRIPVAKVSPSGTLGRPASVLSAGAPLIGAASKAAPAGKLAGVPFFDGGAAGRVPGGRGATVAPDAEIYLIRTLPEDVGGRDAGYSQSEALEELVKRNEGKIKSLNADGASSLFQEIFAVEIQPGAREEMLAELGRIHGIEFHALPELVSLASRREARPLPDAVGIAIYKERLSKGSMVEILRAFAELASAFGSATPEEIAALPVEVRDSIVTPLHNVAGLAVNAYNLVEGGARQEIRRRLRAQRSDIGWMELEKAAQEGVKEPAVSARFEPMRAMLLGTLGTMDGLDTPGARAAVTQILPHADHAGLQFVVSNSERRERYVREWLGAITGAVEETLEGMRLGDARPQGWTGSRHGHGYRHVDGRRESSYLYQWKPGRVDPGEMSHELLLTLGMEGGSSLVDSLLRTLGVVQGGIAQMEALNDEDEKIDGNGVVDKLLLSLRYNPFHMIPGFDEAVYIANALRFFQEAQERVSDPGLVMQLAESAITFLAGVAHGPVLESSPDLRAQAIATWKAVAEKARAMKISITTRMDGVIDPRPQKLLGEPALLQNVDEDSTVWQIAVSPDNRYIARAAGDRTVKVWDARTNVLLKTIQLDDARQLYGDLANSLGVAWTADGRFLVTSLHDAKEGDKSFSYNMVRSFDLASAKDTLTPADAVSAVRIRDVYVLRETAQGPQGPFYATMNELRNEQQFYLGAEVRLLGADGQQLSLIEHATLRDLRGKTMLTAAPDKSKPSLRVWDVSEPRRPIDVTPEWLEERVAAWAQRNPSNYGWWPKISAKLGVVRDRPVIFLHDEGQLQALDLRTGGVLSSVDVPNDWEASPFVVDEHGRYIAAVVKARGEFAGPNPERLMVWNLSTGEIVMERDATFVPLGWIYARGQSVSQLLFSRDGRRLIAAGRRGVQVFDLP